jgi:uncharacterized protein YoxC
MVSGETFYIILTGTISAIAAWIIINAIKYTYKTLKEFTSDIKQIKKDLAELKIKVKALEDNIGDKNE